MGKIIHGTYELLEEVGSGGGGVIYLAQHLNLNKKVILKADRRRATAKPELLRREADILKNLSHTYIPQVYDFFIENGIVFTVIDYVEGESLDKPLKRGEKFPQPVVIKWARELLETLVYLHKIEHGDPPKGYVHSDIKPANLMKKPNGDICLIDFNIAMAFDEEQQTGYSVGYASPEHYGIDYSSGGEDDDGAQIRNAGRGTQTVSKRSSSLFGSTKDKESKVRFSGTVFEDDESENQIKPVVTPEPHLPDAVNHAAETVVQSQANDMGAGGGSPQTPSSGSGEEYSSSAYGSTGNSFSIAKRRIKPDVRSDIYMVGATLYHLLSGLRPAKDAKDVIPLSTTDFSPQIVEIISKAMFPNPDLRYQTAAEMLEAFNRLFVNDPRILTHKKQTKIWFSAIGCALALGVLTAFTGMQRLRTKQIWKEHIDESTQSLLDGNAEMAVAQALQAIPDGKGLWTPEMLPAAQLALTEATGIYDLSPGFKVWKTLELPAEMQFLRISPDGKTALCLYSSEMAIVDTEAGVIIATLSTDKSALSEAEYIDNDTIVYAGVDGLTCYQISTQKNLWTGKPATAVAVSADGTRVAGLYRDASETFVYDRKNGNAIGNIDFADKKQWVTTNDIFVNRFDDIFELNADGSMLACSFSDGSISLYNVNNGSSKQIPMTFESCVHFEGGFYQKYFAFSASRKEGHSEVKVIDLENMQTIGGIESIKSFGVRIEPNGICLQNDTILERIATPSLEQIPLANTSDVIRKYACTKNKSMIASDDAVMFYDSNAKLISKTPCNIRPDFLALSDNYTVIGSMDSASVRIMKYQDYPDMQKFTYDSSCNHIEARISHDYQTVMLFNPTTFYIFDNQGKQLISGNIPDSQSIYDQQFMREADRSYLKVIYYDGTIVCYDAHTGKVIEQTEESPPDASLYEEFLTESYRIAKPLHGSTEIYDLKSGKLLYTIQEDAYMTYATQNGKQLILQFLTTDGMRYGLLLNQNFETIAKLPYLSDVIDGQLVFDYPSGYICSCPIYDIDQVKSYALRRN